MVFLKVGAPLAGAHDVHEPTDIPEPMGTYNPNNAHINVNIHQKNDTPERATARVAPTTQPTVGDVVGAYKSLCVRECLQWIQLNEPQFVLGTLWQRNYWEHIIRNEPELNRIREYIRNNPLKWETDSLL